MIFYHGTTKENWEKIQKEGILWGGDTYHKTGKGYRYTYLTPEIEVAKKINSEIILEVKYDPVGVNGEGIDNYGFDPPPGQTCWQFCVFIPIPLLKVTLLERNCHE